MLPDYILESALWGPLVALGVLVGFLLLGALVNVALFAVIRHRRGRDPRALDVELLQAIKGPTVLFIAVLGLFLGYLVVTQLTHPSLEFFHQQDEWGRKAWLLVMIGEVSYLASHLLQTIASWYLRNVAAGTATDLDSKLLPPLRRVTPMVVYAIGALLALDVLGIPISPLLAGLGIGGLAIALAVQPSLSNYFAGTYLISEGELNEGDYIQLEGGPAGYIVDVGWRSTKIRNRYNNLVIIPNSKMVESIVTNYFSPSPSMNVVVNCGVSYESDLARVEEIVREIANDVIRDMEQAVTGSEPFFGFSAFGDSNIDFYIFLQATDRTGTFIIASEVVKRIHRRFREEGIEINYPVRKLVTSSPNGAQHLTETVVPGNAQPGAE
jgi:small-conductance mechanosensitive channel